MLLFRSSIEAEDPRDSGSPTHTDVSEESPSEEAGDSKEASQPTSPKRKSDETRIFAFLAITETEF